ncbi:MAG: tetratricopeptide repeat protein [Gemmatimonadetes bacterium]|uniref:Tetratricopeptide repeat protein n=1 Tax=Candidatus Kutchimonas denitrificans TaxID=3056748 RepID=A0AAE4Z5M9_9BACT|nr:tetratricopeptide repeat protein [Gemmatimonadota bacterium]NIR73789.1 tetratricopeptide repeat protein [Candidatus Kutchimonas denitrificans]NIS03153.1 tetratricopeptide repeat protein [Gemmatimonadota bacterium]NIT69054.1 tetratricopeptide repeat protein [Gemmatimonadota bacterium]NIU54145.1 hypothetical protein [Gemmatimonadota bacterium]
MSARTDLATYLLGERSELRPLIEAIAAAGDGGSRERAAVEYLLVLATARRAARREAVEVRALEQVRSRYYRVFGKDDTPHARLLRELYASLEEDSAAALATALKLLGLHHRKHGSYRLARASFALTVELTAELPDEIEQLNALFWLGLTERYLGDLDAAEALHREQLSRARQAGAHGQAVLAQENLGLVSLRRGKVAEARTEVLRALQEAESLGDSELEGYCYHALLLVETSAGRPGEAAVCGWEAYGRYESNEQRMRALQDCGVILFEAGLLEAADAAFEIVANGSDDTASLLRAKTGLADVAAARGDRDRFEAISHDLLADENLQALPFEFASALRTVGLGYVTLNEEQRAREYLLRSQTVAESRGLEDEAAKSRQALANLPAGTRAFRPLVPTGSELERLESVGRNVVWERAQVSA